MKLGEVITLQRGFDLPVQNRKAGKIPIVSSSGVSGYHSDVGVRGPGVVTGRYGTIGQVFYLKEDYWPLNTTLWVKDFHDTDPLFASYLLRTIDFESCNDKSSVPGVNRNDLHQIRVRVPPPREQKAIATMLGSLDDKIELNRRMNATLEAMARAFFQSWFVDFDPVRAKLDGRQPTGLNRATAELFPNEFEDSELGPIPKGWEVLPLGDLIELAYGKALKADDRREGPIGVYGSNGLVGWHNEKLVKGPGIVVGRKGNPGVVTWVHDDFFPIDTTFYVVPSDRCRSLHFLNYALQTHDLPNLSADSAVPGLNRNHAYMSKQLVPPPDVLMAFDNYAVPLLKRVRLNEHRSRSLATIRDALLPKLLSGELRLNSGPVGS